MSCFRTWLPVFLLANLYAPAVRGQDEPSSGAQTGSSQIAEAPVEDPESQGKDIADSVVKLNVTARAPDFFRPWTKAAPSKASGSGVVIAGPRILTNAHVVMHASEVLIQLRQGGDTHVAEVKAIAPGIDLAVVELKDPSVLEGIEPVELAEDLPQIKSQVSVYGYPQGGEDLSVTDGIVSRIEFASYNFGTAGVRVQVDAALNPGNSGGPAIQDGKIIGLVFSKIQEADNIGYLIPPEEIEAFLDDAGDGRYEGRPMMFDAYQTAENDALRKYLKMPREKTGVVVAEPYCREEDRDEYPLKKWDVITHVGPHEIDNQGYVEARPGLRLRFLYYVPKLTEDDKLELTILRDGAATQEYLRALGGQGSAMLLALDSPLLKRLNDFPEEPSEQLVLIGTRLFPHPITKGYDNRPLAVIDKVNGIEIENLKHLAGVLQDNDKEFLKIEMADKSEALVFRSNEIKEATEEILVDEGIRYQSSEDLRDILEEE
jgi:S1-C subfamily serine protease